MAVNNFAPAEYGGYVLGANSGGGGGGDLSTAEVTVVNNVNRMVADVININNDVYFEGMITQAEIPIGTSTITAVMYKNYCEFYIDALEANVEVTGDISYDGSGLFAISGNGTITMS